jgi:hypothetical protein
MFDGDGRSGVKRFNVGFKTVGVLGRVASSSFFFFEYYGNVIRQIKDEIEQKPYNRQKRKKNNDHA